MAGESPIKFSRHIRCDLDRDIAIFDFASNRKRSALRDTSAALIGVRNPHDINNKPQYVELFSAIAPDPDIRYRNTSPNFVTDLNRSY